eukprot:scaffold34634_cov171-Amphora_coffeaeformis.AAC.3
MSGTPSDPVASTSTSDNKTSDVIDFLSTARGLKTTLRTGWVMREAGPRIESVADHSWRITLMAMVAGASVTHGVDGNKVLQMALVHDLAESTVGDITPHCGVSDKDKHAMELEAMEKLTMKLGEQGKQFLELWQEYEKGESMEAKLCKDLDKLEMILQALEYEKDGKNKKSLDGFFDSTRGKWRTELGATWGAEIEARRSVNRTDDATKTKGEPETKKQKTDG